MLSENLELICYSLAALTLAVPGLFLVALWALRKRERKVVSTYAHYETFYDAPAPQPDAPCAYGSKPDPAAAPVSRREFDDDRRVLRQYHLGQELEYQSDRDRYCARLDAIEARLDAIEKPVRKCRWCGGWARVWVRGHGWGMRCPDCNGTGREEA